MTAEKIGSGHIHTDFHTLIHQIHLWLSTKLDLFPSDLSPNKGREVGHEKG